MTSERKKALVLYNGSSRGQLSGGEYAHKVLRNTLRQNFEVSEILSDDVVRKFRSRFLRKLLNKLMIPFMVIFSYVLYPKFDIVVTSWTPKIPYYGDITYVQPFARSSTVFGSFDSVISPQSIIADSLMYLPNKLLSGPSRRRHTFVANSIHTQDRLYQEMYLRSVVVYPPVPIQSPVEMPKKEDLVTSFGRVVPSKRFDALTAIGPEIPETKFVLIGALGLNGKEIVSSIQKSFELKGVRENFSYLGWISDQEKLLLLGKSKVLFHPSINEPFGIGILEGMACGAIPIVHNSGGPREFVPRDWLFDDYAEATKKIKIALKTWSPSIGKQMRDISLRFSQSNFQQNFSKLLLTTADRKTKKTGQ